LIGVLVTAILVAWVVWTYQKVISEADRNTYEFLGFGKKDFKNGIKRDNYNIYDRDCFPNELRKNIDVGTFEKVSNCFMKDKNFVYYKPACGQACDWDKFIDIDSTTFE